MRGVRESMTKGRADIRDGSPTSRSARSSPLAPTGSLKSRFASPPRSRSLQRTRNHLSQDDFRSLITVSSAAICCMELLEPVSCSLPPDEFVRTLYSIPSRCLEASLTLALWTGHSTVDALLGCSLSDLFPPETRSPEMFRHWRLLSLSAQGFEVELEHLSSWRRTCQSVIYGRIFDEQLTRIWIVLRDITPQARALKALSVAENHYRSLVEHPGLLFVRVRPDGTYEHMSRTTQETLGISLEEANVTPCTVFRLVHPEDIPRAQAFLDARSAGSEEVLESEHRLRLRDGRYHWFLVRQFPKLNADGDIDSYDLVAIDIQRQRELARRAERLSSAAVVGELSAGAAHDLNNFLTIAEAQLGDAITEASAGSRNISALEAVRQVLASCRGIGKQLMEMSAQNPQPDQQLDLSAIVVAVGSLIRYALPARITLTVSTIGKDLWIRGDAIQLQRAILNLVLNARDAISGLGEIIISAESTSAGNALISVRDSGPGIPQDLAQYLFQPLFSTKHKTGGHGLGLVSSQAIAESLSGRITFRNHPAGGAEFSLILPLISGRSSPLPTPTASSCRVNKSTRRLTIFIAEDLPELRASMLSTLSAAGHSPVAFPDAESLISFLSTSPTPPDLFILDENLPGRSGSNLAGQLRAFLPTTSILLTSGALLTRQSTPLGSSNLGCLQKPYSPKDLLQAVQDSLRHGVLQGAFQ